MTGFYDKSSQRTYFLERILGLWYGVWRRPNGKVQVIVGIMPSDDRSEAFVRLQAWASGRRCRSVELDQ